MSVTKTRRMYKAFGLSILSDIELPELPVRAEDDLHLDVEIRLDHDLIAQFPYEPYDFVVDAGTVSVLMPDTAVFRIENGKHIRVGPLPGADEALIRLYVLGTCMGALLLQRGIYPLHGSAVEIDGKAYAFVGHSGAGKSTLASAFINNGYKLLSDDVIAVLMPPAADAPLVVPSYPQQKLWQQSLDAFGVSHTGYRSIYGREDKFCIPVADDFHYAPLPLAGVFELVKTEEQQVSLHAVKKLERLDLLFRHTYRQFLLQRMELAKWHFSHSAALASAMPMYLLGRPADRFSAPQLVELILQTIKNPLEE